MVWQRHGYDKSAQAIHEQIYLKMEWTTDEYYMKLINIWEKSFHKVSEWQKSRNCYCNWSVSNSEAEKQIELTGQVAFAKKREYLRAIC